MILDVLENHVLYSSLAGGLPSAFKFLLETDLAALPVGRIDLNGERLYAMSQSYITREPGQGRWEAHRKYIDVQYMLSGCEYMGHANLRSMLLGEYQPEKDFQPLEPIETGIGNTIKVCAGQFVIFFQEDAHKPGLCDTGSPEAVRKVVLKVRV